MQARSYLVIDAHNGTLEKQISELDDSIKSETYPEINEHITDETNQELDILNILEIEISNHQYHNLIKILKR